MATKQTFSRLPVAVPAMQPVIDDLYDQIAGILSRPAATPITATSTPTVVSKPTVAAIDITAATGQASGPQYAYIPVLPVLPSANPVQGAPYAVNGLMIEVGGQFYIYMGAPTYAWQIAGASISESSIANAEWLTVTGTANAIIGTTVTASFSLAEGFVFRLIPTATNTGAVTLAVDGNAAQAVTKNGSAALIGGELQIGRGYLLLYDGTQFQILGVIGPENATVLASNSTGVPIAAPLPSADIWVGNGSNLPAAVALSGDATLANTGALTLATVNSAPGTYGDSTDVAQISVNAKGLVTGAVNVPISFPASVPPGTYSGTINVGAGTCTITLP